MSAFWQDRPTFVTGGTGLVGSWLVKRLIAEGAHVVCLVRDWVPESELVRSGRINQVTIVRGDIRDQATLERALGEHEIDTVIHLAAQTIVGIANRNPVSTFEANIQGNMVASRSVSSQPEGESDCQRLVGQGIRRSRNPALRRSDSASRPASVRCQQILRRSDRINLCQQLRATRRHDPLRQFLRRRRS